MQKRLFKWSFLLALAAFAAVLAFHWSNSEPAYHGKTISEWVASLNSGSSAQRLEAERALKAIGPAAVPYLSHTLSKKPGILDRLNRSIGTYIPAKLKKPFRKLFDPAELVMDKYAAAQALRIMSTNAQMAAPALGKALLDPNVLISDAAGRALGQIGPEAIPYLLKALDSSSYVIRANACSALAQLGTNSAPSVPRLIRIVREETGPIVSSSAYTLSRIGQPAVSSLMTLLDSTNSATRRWAAFSLGYAGPAAHDAIPSLLRILNDDNAEVRWMVVNAISRIDVLSEEVGNALMQAINDPDERVRASALGELANRPVIVIQRMPEFIAMLLNDSASVRAQAAYALGQTGEYAVKALPALKRLLDDPEFSVSDKARKAIETIRASVAAKASRADAR